MIAKGWIALDIDGTITLDKYSVPGEVAAYLRSLSQSGWNIAMATGRPFAFAKIALSQFDFPYLFIGQNGSIALEMPGEVLSFKAYMPVDSLKVIEQAFEGIESDFLVYAGYEKGDFCYWRPHRFSGEDLDYLLELQTRQKEKWQKVDRYDPSKFDPFPMIKCFGSSCRMDLIAGRLKAAGRFEIAKIRDPFAEGYYILLVSDRQASKGRSLSRVFELKGRGARVIAAGDDENDLSLLGVADIKIAMSHAPETLRQAATFVAPPTQELGIIQALRMALSL